ncbi:5'-AMP-activated serine/threonine-protein kinase catalytic subunit alpha [Condylostylus longicornis]|uniref:5'-AMP-activated serine/threonine-protein kinase catalytic subunit alpha n=1 Tax=Condylostylus longicornis TaxID=2530218 RepID=UPI00244E4E21|nr:5'-AMP-activated serine/threonine-protein kinase catalytic subunit alpha [Condylostylus longicornis]
MIYIDDNDPEGVLEPYFPPRDVAIKYNTNPIDFYDTIEEIGRGKFGTVYKCREKSTGLKLAAKFIPIPKREDRRNVEREVEIMNSLQHHLIIQLYAAFEYQKMMYVIQELVEGGELFDRVIDDEFVLTERTCTVFMRQICEAMQFIHSKYILHLDLKPENILCLTKEGNRIKIIDFGLARKYDPDKKLQILFGTPEFVAPEVVNFDCISYGTDMWSVGVICYVLLSGLSPFMGETDLATMANVTVAKYDFDDEAFNNVSPEAMDFISKLLVKELDERMSATEALEHKWLKRPPKPAVSPKPNIVPPIKFKTSPPSPMTITDDIKESLNEKELEQTKDNLKSFIERWEEHPNSPYVFDSESNLIVPLRDNNSDSINSSRACSPSPCESIVSLTEQEINASKEDLSNKTLTPSSTTTSFNLQRQSSLMDSFNSDNDNLTPSIHKTQEIDNDSSQRFNQDFKEYLQSFERRNSDTNYLLGRKSSGERVNLADEIKKLSEHLLMLAEINNKLGQEDDTSDDNKSVNLKSNENNKIIKESNDDITEFNIVLPKRNTQNTTMNYNKKPLIEKQKSLNSDLPKLKPQFDRQNTISSTATNDRWSVKTNNYTLVKSPTITSQMANTNIVNKNKSSTSSTINNKLNTITSRQSTLQSEDDDYSTSSTLSVGSVTAKDDPNLINHTIINDKSQLSWNNERRLSDTQNAALTISKFVQISQGKEKTTQSSIAQHYKEQQRHQEQQYQQQKQQQQNNLINNRRISTLSVLLHQSIDNVPRLTNGTKEYDDQYGKQSRPYYQNQYQNDQSILMNGGAQSSSSYETSLINDNKKNITSSKFSHINNDLTKTMTNGYSGYSSSTSTKQVTSIKESIENNKDLSENIQSASHIINSGRTQRRMSSSIASIFEKFSDNSNNMNNIDTDELNSTNQFRIGVPWAMHTKKRTKFRINETSRDVPIGSPNKHQTYNLEEAATQTKDCLLHLLEKYNDTKGKSSMSTGGGHSGRHQSISVDWSFSQNLENQTMSSINTFFQRHAIAGGTVRNIQAQLESKNSHEGGE